MTVKPKTRSEKFSEIQIEKWRSSNIPEKEIKKNILQLKTNVLRMDLAEERYHLRKRGFLMSEEVDPDKKLNYAYSANEETANSIEQDQEQLEILKLIVISEKSKFSQVWGIVEIGLSCVSVFFYGWMAAFYSDEIYHTSRIYELSIESFFFLNMIKKGFTDYTPEGSTAPVRRMSKVLDKYIKESLVYDLIPLVPVTICFLHYNKYVRVFYLVKMFRIHTLKNMQFQQDLFGFYKEVRLKQI